MLSYITKEFETDIGVIGFKLHPHACEFLQATCANIY